MKKNIFFCFLLVITFASCSKNHHDDCSAILSFATSVPVQPIRFRILNKQTSESLFFSADAKYTSDQLTYFTYKNGSEHQDKIYDTIPFAIDSLNMNFIAAPLSDSVFAHIAGLSIDTLSNYRYGKSVPDGPCNFTRLADTIMFDNQTYTTDTGRVFNFKK